MAQLRSVISALSLTGLLLLGWPVGAAWAHAELERPIAGMNLQENAVAPIRMYWWILGKGIEEQMQQAFEHCNSGLYLTTHHSLQNLLRDIDQELKNEPESGLAEDRTQYSEAMGYYEQAWQHHATCQTTVDFSTVETLDDETIEHLVTALNQMQKGKTLVDLESLGLTDPKAQEQFDAVRRDFERANRTIPYYLVADLPLFWDTTGHRLLNDRMKPISEADLVAPKTERTTSRSLEVEPVPVNTANAEVDLPLPALPDESSPKVNHGDRIHSFADDWRNWTHQAHQASCDIEVDAYQVQLRSLIDAGWDAGKPSKKGSWTAVLSYKLQRNGQIDDVEVLKASGIPAIEKSAIARIYEVQGLVPPFPDCLHDDQMTVQHAFKVIYR